MSSKRKRGDISGSPRDVSEASREATPRFASYKPPGRLGNPRMELQSDPRANQALVQSLAQFGMDRNRAPPSLSTLSSMSSTLELGASMAEAERGFESIYDTLPCELPSDLLELETEHTVETMFGPDHNLIDLHIYRPVLRGGPLPCVVYFHGGSMTILKTENKTNKRWCTSLAASGLVCVAVDFRNAWDNISRNFRPFPAGLNDCCAAVKHIHNARDELNIRNLILHGSGGGGNLALAVALKARREYWLPMISGCYVLAPYISNAYSWAEERKLRELPSLIENHGYFLNIDYQAYMAHVYTPSHSDSTNPLAWPYHASIQELEGLPPHVLVMDELDPLRDEGAAYAKKLQEAGTPAVGKVILGTSHAASLVFRQALPELNKTAVRECAAFAKAL